MELNAVVVGADAVGAIDAKIRVGPVLARPAADFRRMRLQVVRLGYGGIRLRRRQLQLGNQYVPCIHGSDPDAGEKSGAVDANACCHVELIDFEAIEPQRITTHKPRD